SHAIYIEPQFACGQSPTNTNFFGFASLGGFGDLGHLLAWYHHDSVGIGNHHITRVDDLTSTDDRNIDRAQGFFHGASRVDCFGKYREMHLLKVCYVTDPTVDHQSGPTASAEGRDRKSTRLNSSHVSN